MRSTEPMEIVTASRDITPRSPLPLCGYEARVGPSESVHDPLELNGIRLIHRGVSEVILSADLAYASPQLVGSVRCACERIGVPGVNCIVAASHTHSAPSVLPHFPRLGTHDDEYVQLVQAQAVSLVEELGAVTPRQVAVRHASGLAQHSVHRRRRDLVMREWRPALRWQMAPDPSVASDESVQVIAFVGAQERPLGVMWGYACHPVGFPALSSVSADFPGFIRMELRRLLGPEIPIVFMQGFSGDTRPMVCEVPTSLRSKLRSAVNGPRFGRFSLEGYEAWSRSLSSVVGGAVEAALKGQDAGPSLRSVSCRVPFREFVDGEGPIAEVEFQRVDLAEDLTLVAVSAEAMTDHVQMAREVFPRRRVVPVGCANAAVGYLPTSRMVEQGGYEGGECLTSFGTDGRYTRDITERVFAALRSLATPDS